MSTTRRFELGRASLEGSVDWKNVRSLKEELDNHFFSIGIEFALQYPDELLRLLKELQPADDYSYLELEKIGAYCEALIEAIPLSEKGLQAEIRRNSEIIIGFIEAFNAGLRVSVPAPRPEVR